MTEPDGEDTAVEVVGAALAGQRSASDERASDDKANAMANRLAIERHPSRLALMWPKRGSFRPLLGQSQLLTAKRWAWGRIDVAVCGQSALVDPGEPHLVTKLSDRVVAELEVSAFAWLDGRS